MRVMAIDYGDARTGVAVSDPTGLIAGECFRIAQWDAEVLADQIVRAAKDRDVGTLVLGLPRNMDGTEGPRAAKARAFKTLLEERGMDVVLWDERRTTVDAHRILRENGKREKKHRDTVDAVAAALILEGYLGSLS